MSAPRADVLEVDTPLGPARIHLLVPRWARGTLLLGHGAGGGIDTPDLRAMTLLSQEGWAVLRLEQPWRVAGKRVASRPAQLDLAFLAALAQLRRRRRSLPRPLVSGGRSAGARVACRTAVAARADAVLALSFPLVWPGRPARFRAAEAVGVLDAGVPLAVIQGRTDPFGGPQDIRAALGERVTVYDVPGTHELRPGLAAVLDAARNWLDTVGPRQMAPSVSARPAAGPGWGGRPE